MPSIKKQLDSLLNQEMDRKNFLKYSGGIVLAVLGVTGLVRILLSSKQTTSLLAQADTEKKGRGYGSSKYGQ